MPRAVCLALLVAIALATACTRRDTPASSPDDATAALTPPRASDVATASAPSAIADAAPRSAAGLVDASLASVDASGSDAWTAAGASPDAAPPSGPCARCAADEYCQVVHRSGGVQPIRRSTRVTCEKFSSVEGGCRSRSCACFDQGYQNQACSMKDGHVRVEVVLNMP